MTKNEIVGRLKDGSLDASSTNRNSAVYVSEAREGRATAGWFAFRIICDSDATERRARGILSRYYDIESIGNVWRLKSRNRVPLMAIKREGVPPVPTGTPMYFEAKAANSTVSMMSMLPTAPNLEYSTDGVTWQEWQHTTADGTHTFDTITLGAVGDRVYFRGDNPDGLAGQIEGQPLFSLFNLTGSAAAGGNVMSLLDKTMQLTEVPDFGFSLLFASLGDEGDTTLIAPPDMSSITAIGYNGCASMYMGKTALTTTASIPALVTIGDAGCATMYAGCISLTAAADMPALTTISDNMGCFNMYLSCIFDMSNDGLTLNFAFPTPPITAGETTYSTAFDVAQWMGNTNGFTNP